MQRFEPLEKDLRDGLPLFEEKETNWRTITAIISGCVALLCVGYLIGSLVSHVEFDKKATEIRGHLDKIKAPTDSTVQGRMEYSYLEGQRDALTGNIRVEKQDSMWLFTKSPWDADSGSKYAAIPKVTIPIKEDAQ